MSADRPPLRSRIQPAADEARDPIDIGSYGVSEPPPSTPVVQAPRQTAPAPAPASFRAPPPERPEPEELVQFNSRIRASARQKLIRAAKDRGLTVRAFLEAYADSL